MKKIKTILLFIVVLIFQNSFTAKAQTEGFLGKRNQVQYDAFGTAYQGVFGFTYGYSFSKHFMMQLGFGLQNKDYDIPANNTTGVAFVSNVNSKRFCVGFITNGGNAGMNLPIGYYAGFNIKFMSALVEEQFKTGTLLGSKENTLTGLYDNSLNISQQNFDCKINSYGMTIVMGKNFYLTQNITLDLSFETGMTYYSYTYLNPAVENGYYNEGFSIVDNRGYYYSINNVPTPLFEFWGNYSFWRGLFNSVSLTDKNYYDLSKAQTTTNYKFFGVRLVFMPSVKLGYIF